MNEMTSLAVLAPLYLKLAKVMGKISNIPKNGFNAEQKYAFVRDADVLDMVRALLSEEKIAFLVTMTNKTLNDAGTTKSGTPKTHYILDFAFTFADCETGQSITQSWAGESIEFSDKGLSKAATSAEKTFLLKTFMIPTGNEETDDKTINRGDDRQQRKQEPVAQWPNTELVGNLIKASLEKLEVTADEIATYTGIENLDDIESWSKYADRKAAGLAIKEGHDKHMAEIAASKPATPKAETSSNEEIKHDPNEWINGNVNAFLSHWLEQGMTHPQIKAALKINDRWSEWKGTVKEATEAVEAYRKPKTLPPDVEAAQKASKPVFDGVTPPAVIPDEAELRRNTLARLEGEAVTLFRVEKANYVQGQGKAEGWKWIGHAMITESDGIEHKVEVRLFPEDVDAISRAGHAFPRIDAAVNIDVILHIENDMIRINRDKLAAKDTTPIAASPFGKGKFDPEAQKLWEELPGISDAAKHQLEA